MVTVAWTGGSRGSSIRHVAHVAGVSASTVSNVLNKPHLVTTETRQRVEDAMGRIGYVRNGAARQLRGAPSAVVGCVMVDGSNPFFAEVARGVEDRLAEADCMLVLCSTDRQVERQMHYLRMLQEQGVRGVLVNPADSELDRLLTLSRQGTPVVLLDRPRNGTDLCAAMVDNVKGGELAAEHLFALGHRRIVFLRGSIDLPTITARGDGIRRAVRAAGLDPARTIVDIRYADMTDARATDVLIGEVLRISPRPTAIVCYNDATALAVVLSLRRLRIAVPETVSVVGYDDVQFAAALSPALTTVRQPKYELGRAAAELLLNEADPDHRHRQVVFQPELVIRDSTARLPDDRAGC